MTSKIRAEDLSFEVLSSGVDLSGFSCGDHDTSGVDEFIHSEALRYQEDNMGITYLFYSDGEIVGFVTLSMNSLHISQIPDKEVRDYPVRLPIVLIGQLGVDNKHRHRNIGKQICEWSYGKAIDLATQVGCRYVALHTTPDLIKFYEKCGFEATDPSKESILMVRKIIKPLP